MFPPFKLLEISKSPKLIYINKFDFFIENELARLNQSKFNSYKREYKRRRKHLKG